MLFSSKISAALAIDPREKKIRFYSMNRTDRSGIIYDEQTFRPACFSAGFYQEFAAIAQSFLEKYTSVAGAPVTVILPDSAIFADLVVLPGMNRMAVRGALNTALNSAFKNRNELKINDTCLIQNKQTTKISLCGVRQEILTATRSALSGVKLSPQGFTFGANTTATAAAELNPKLRGGTYLLMDISQNETRVVYVLHGCAVAFGALPFGYAVMEKQRVAAEDMLFDHSVAELAVLNARERAKQKALTMMGGEGTVDAADAEAIAAAAQNTEAAKTEDAPKPEEPVKEDETPEEEDDDLIGADGDEEEEEDDEDERRRNPEAIKVLPRKTARKLPKYMLRPTPNTKEGFLYENFRLFMKWSLCYLQQNQNLTSVAAPDAVYVNLPADFSSVFERANAELSENRIAFRPLGIDAAPENIARHLELYGGLIAGRSGKNNFF